MCLRRGNSSDNTASRELWGDSRLWDGTNRRGGLSRRLSMGTGTAGRLGPPSEFLSRAKSNRILQIPARKGNELETPVGIGVRNLHLARNSGDTILNYRLMLPRSFGSPLLWLKINPQLAFQPFQESRTAQRAPGSLVAMEKRGFLFIGVAPEELLPVGCPTEKGGHLHQFVVLLADVGGGAAPPLLPGAFAQSCPHRIPLHVDCCGQQVFFVHHAGSKTVLPEVSSPVLPEVHMTAVAPVSLPDGQAQAIFRGGHKDQVNMVRHQAIRPHRHTVFRTPMSHQFTIQLVVLVAEECRLSPVAPLGHVVGVPGNHNACDSWHAITLTVARFSVNN